jgi:hypothetical protein
VTAYRILLDLVTLLFRMVHILFIFQSAFHMYTCFLTLYQQHVIKLFSVCQHNTYKVVNQYSPPPLFRLLFIFTYCKAYNKVVLCFHHIAFPSVKLYIITIQGQNWESDMAQQKSLTTDPTMVSPELLVLGMGQM